MNAFLDGFFRGYWKASLLFSPFMLFLTAVLIYKDWGSLWVIAALLAFGAWSFFLWLGYFKR